MTIQPFSLRHLQPAARLAEQLYRRERAHVPVLPDRDLTANFAAYLRSLPADAGVVAVEDGVLLGYLCALPVDRMFGLCPGAYSPLWAHGAACRPREVIPRLYEAVGGDWVRGGRLTHSVALYAHDPEAIAAWFELGFGGRCVDAIRALGPVEGARATGLTIRRADARDAAALLPLFAALDGALSRPPLFMPVFAPPTREQVRASLTQDEVWAAFDGSEAVGYLLLRPQAETFVAADPDTRNICGAYVREDQRGAGVAAALLQAAVDALAAAGYARCGVDYECFNRLGSRFWDRHFTRYTAGVTRRIDERILWANERRLETGRL